VIPEMNLFTLIRAIMLYHLMRVFYGVIPMHTPKNQMSKDLANSLFYYRNGGIYWRKKQKKIPLEREAGCIHHSGYRIVGYKKSIYMVHNIIWNMHNGIIPDGYTVDHIDRKRDNNILDNLRLATPSQQQHNKKCIGVHFANDVGKWQARIMVNKTRFNLGYFDKKQDAIEARKKAEQENGIKI
jgi:hypothetical protein